MHQGHQFAMLLRKAYLSFHRRANVTLRNCGVTADQFVLLDVVANDPGITQIAIVDRTSSDPNTVAAVLKLLERRGFVRREPHARDGRARCVYLTAEGRRVLRRATKTATSFLMDLSNCLQDCDATPLEESLRKIHDVFSSQPVSANGQSPRRTTKRKTPA